MNDWPPNPFVGLRPFESEEALLFFGRSEQTVELLQLLHQYRFLAVVGSSGCGKSSLVRAGLIPNLKAGMLVEDRDRWLIATMKPGNHPLQNLGCSFFKTLHATHHTIDEKSLNQAIQESGVSAILQIFDEALAKTDTSLLLLVDQFEEIFRFCLHTGDEQQKIEATDFVSQMLALTEQRIHPIYVVITMRSDFLGDCDAFFGLPEAMNHGQYLVPRLSRQKRREVIEGPIRLYRREIASRLVDRIVNEVGNDPDQLPVMQHALMRLWEKGQRDKSNVLDLSLYQAIGSVEEALSRHAEEALDGISAEELTLTGQIFKTLTDTDSTNRSIRRPAHLSEIEAITGQSPEKILEVIDRFRSKGRSFLVISEDNKTKDPLIDISHEALIRKWERLKNWGDSEAEAGNIYRRIADAAQRFKARKGSLLSDLDLQQALEWKEEIQPNEAWAKRFGLGYREAMAFLQISQETHQKKLADEETRERELQLAREREKITLQKQVELSQKHALQVKRFAILLIFIIIIVSSVCIFAWRQWQQAKLIRYEAKYYLANLFEEKASAAMEEALENKLPEENYQKALLYTLEALAQDIGPGKSLPVSIGRLLRADIITNVFNEIWASPASSPNFYGIGLSPDDKYRAPRSEDNSVHLFRDLKGTVRTMVFSPDRKYLVFMSEDKSIHLYDVATGREVAVFSGHTGAVRAVAFSPDGKYLVAGSRHGISLWDVASRKKEPAGSLKFMKYFINRVEFSSHPRAIRAVAFSLDSKYLASESVDNSIRLYDVKTEREVAVFSGHTGAVRALAFSPDGKYLASGSEDNSIRLYEVATDKEVAVFRGHTGTVRAVAFSPDGKYLASGSEDNSIRLYEVATDKEVAIFRGHTGPVRAVAFSPGGKYLTSGSEDNSIRLYDVKTGKEVAIFRGHTGPVRAVAFSPDGKYLASGSEDNSIRLYEVATDKEVAVFRGHTGPVRAVAFSPDGKYLTSGSEDNSIRLYDVKTDEEVAVLRGQAGTIMDRISSPDGRYVASGIEGNAISLYDTETDREVAVFSDHTGTARAVAFSPDSKYLVAGSADNSIRLYEVATGRELAVFSGHTGTVSAVAFSPDGKYLASGSKDKKIRLWKLFLLHDYLVAGKKSYAFQTIYQVSRSLLPFRLEGLKFWPKQKAQIQINSNYKAEDIHLTLKADTHLNLKDKTPHTLHLCIYQLRDPIAFNQFTGDEKGLLNLLECRDFDSSVSYFESATIQPGQNISYSLDRAEGAKYVAIVAGYYYEIEKERISRLIEIPIQFETKGISKKIGVFKTGTLEFELTLGQQQIQKVEIK